MKNRSRVIVFCVVFFIAVSVAFGLKSEGTMAFTVSMERPSTHYYHVVFRCEGIKSETVDFKMPVWTPGYYRIMDFSQNVVRFRAEDGAGHALAWEKITKNTWRVKSDESNSIMVSYDVYAFKQFVADSFLDETRGFISPAGVFMHIAGQILHPVTVTVKPYQGFGKISTGLDPVEGQPSTFFAQDFDVLYDCPILIGNQETLSFKVKGVDHVVAIAEPGSFNREKLVSVLVRMVESAVAVIGEIPYRHYTFIIMDGGRGGLEHLNSMAVFSSIPNLDDPNSLKGWLGFIAHEFFHLYNVKRIQPIALGPFDYDKENYTKMLWLSEGATVYYEFLILNRAGFLSRDEFLERVQNIIRRYENMPGHLYQSATEASFDTWIMPFFGRDGNAANTTISYYDKGAVLGMLLDLKIRQETKSKKSLDDVMRILYQKYYKEKKRGFTDKEFREVCESVAGCPLQEIFNYVSTVEEIDYPKYLAYAGLDIEIPRELPKAYFGADIRLQDGVLVISSVEWDSPASNAGLSAEDEIIALDGKRVSSKKIDEILNSKKPGDKVSVLLLRRNMIRELEVVLGKKTEGTFKIKPLPNPTPLQSAILNDWLKEQ